MTPGLGHFLNDTGIQNGHASICGLQVSIHIALTMGVESVDLGGMGVYIRNFFRQEGMISVITPPPIFLYRKFIEFRYVKFEVF